MMELSSMRDNQEMTTYCHHCHRSLRQWRKTTRRLSCLAGMLLLISSDFVPCHAQQNQYQRQQQQPISRRRQRRPLLNPNPTTSVIMEDLEDQVRAMNNVNHQEYDPTAIDDMLEEVMGSFHSDDTSVVVVDRFLPSRIWMWQQWSGTALKHCFLMAYSNMLSSALMCLFLRRIVYGDWKVWCLPPYTTPIIAGMDPTNIMVPQINRTGLQILDMIYVLWKSLQLLTTILLVVFVGQAYSFWTACYVVCRDTIQGTIHDLLLLASSRAARRRNGTYTPDAERFLNQLRHQLRAFHVWFWASQTNRYRLLLTDPATSRMVAKGLLTQHEKETLDRKLAIPKTQRHWILLEWISMSIQEASVQQSIGTNERDRRRPFSRLGLLRKDPVLKGVGLDHVLLEKICVLRKGCQQLGNKLAARIPMPYVHLVRILVDSYLLLAPIALFKELGIFAAAATAILSIFYLGLLELAFAMLDPLDDHEQDSCREDKQDTFLYLDVSVLLRETATISQRWIDAGSKLRNKWK
ncbi:bestrophin, RFP-TM, chloride channel [Nitzschia inconspicua]|uniref:Bestrophin, RFP-TM, chloride channel n=1 Tax=Nitzschia inconspicua TaxID=303405 RepID=A0A9K3KCF4_9STRA|nr:bestrophin, RFP-TM, chloride channel [Nitzschia inconspicua]